MRPHGTCAPTGVRRPAYQVADIFRAHGAHYRATHPLSADQRKAMWCIEACRTAVLGGQLDVCAACGYASAPAYNSCRNRNCPTCQALDQARWLARRRARMLPVACVHVVFTLPGELKAVALRNRKPLFNILFAAAAQTLLELGRNPQRLGGLRGITAVLHTWTRDLRFHPHLHCVVTAGGLTPDATRWVDSRRGFLFPVAVLSTLFRGKFLAALERLHRDDALDLRGTAATARDFAQLRTTLFSKPWVVYAKRPFAGPDRVFAYLGRYTHRVAISNHRLLAVTDDAVTIATRDGQRATWPLSDFIRRFLLHVVPTGFVRIRHYGLWASGNVNTKLHAARQLVAPDDPARRPDRGDAPPAADWRQLLATLTGIDLHVCPACGRRALRSHRLPPDRRAAPAGCARATGAAEPMTPRQPPRQRHQSSSTARSPCARHVPGPPLAASVRRGHALHTAATPPVPPPRHVLSTRWVPLRAPSRPKLT